MDFGPRRSNPGITGITNEQSGKIANGLAVRGANVSRTSDYVWNMAGGYIAATSQMYRTMDALRPVGG